MTKRNLWIVALLFSFATISNAQDNVYQTFKDTRVINSHTIETVAHRKLDFRIGHRFGPLSSGWQGLYGFENAADVMFSFEYGFSNNLTIGVGRTKGVGPLTSLINPSVKYRILQQKTEGGSPVSLTLLGVSTISTMEKTDIEGVLSNFEKFAHRMSYTTQLLIARKFSDRFSLQIMPGYTHRNRVAVDDVNGIFSVGAVTRIQINKVFGIIADFTLPIADRADQYITPLGVGLEIETGGHIFQLNVTNAAGIIENDYIPYTLENSDGGMDFRIGFTISRLFNL